MFTLKNSYSDVDGSRIKEACGVYLGTKGGSLVATPRDATQAEIEQYLHNCIWDVVRSYEKAQEANKITIPSLKQM